MNKVYVIFKDNSIYLIYGNKIEALKHLELLKNHEMESKWTLEEHEVQKEF